MKNFFVANTSVLETPRCLLRLASNKDTHLLLDYYVRNKSHLAPWEPVRNEYFFTREQFRNKIQQAKRAFAHDQAVHFIALNHQESQITAICNFSNIVRGPFQAAHLGYSIDYKYQGCGMMQEILTTAIDYMFTEQKLHRIMANFIPSNARSEALLKKMGFIREGYARDYLHIAGKWQDHVLTAKVNSDHLFQESL